MNRIALALCAALVALSCNAGDSTTLGALPAVNPRIVTEGTACSGTGLQGMNTAGLILSCQPEFIGQKKRPKASFIDWAPVHGRGYRRSWAMVPQEPASLDQKSPGMAHSDEKGSPKETIDSLPCHPRSAERPTLLQKRAPAFVGQDQACGREMPVDSNRRTHPRLEDYQTKPPSKPPLYAPRNPRGCRRTKHLRWVPRDFGIHRRYAQGSASDCRQSWCLQRQPEPARRQIDQRTISAAARKALHCPLVHLQP